MFTQDGQTYYDFMDLGIYALEIFDKIKIHQEDYLIIEPKQFQNLAGL